ncbi:MAG: 50S ribosome-binding GTPase [Anaerolineae bacterium]|nr:50S ribosome-binding GTPase [Anaerolineae bacterium]
MTETHIDQIIEGLPESTRAQARDVWNALPPGVRDDLGATILRLPSGPHALRDIFGFVLDQYRPVWGDKRSVAVVGPANVGKSTLYNQLITQDQDRAAVSPVPGTTRSRQASDAGLFVLVDTPGADAVGAVGQREREIAFEAAQSADFLVIMFDAVQGIKQAERELFEALAVLDRPYIVVLNKMDLIGKRDREAVVASAAANLGLNPFQIIQTVATEGENVEKVVLGIVKAQPALAAILAEMMPHYRSKIGWQRIFAAAGGAGVVGLTPLPLADVVPLLAIQVGLVLSLARIYGFQITVGRAKELIAAFGIGLLGRTLFYQLSKLGGVPGWLLSATVAAATTVALGYATMAWFAYGEKPSSDALRRLTNRVATRLRERLLGLGKKKPEKASLRDRIVQALHELRGELEEEPPPREDIVLAVKEVTE